ncbi:MAG: DNA cytosine methyltransferase [Chloroflexales bacterium]|nr:DNA cytosine methyltransferase [Chloroflexales bacterium]
MANDLTFYEFFAGGGLARMGLGPHWECLFANDIDEKKAHVYRSNFSGGHELVVADINRVTTAILPGHARLAWASFPCQDLSLAGNGKGLHAERSGAFWPFWDLITGLDAEGRGIPIIMLENVVGLLTSNKGADFQALVSVLVDASYRFGPLIMDAVHFVPQSRPRLFIVAVKDDWPVQDAIIAPAPTTPWHPAALVKAYHGLVPRGKNAWVWWSLPQPAAVRPPLQTMIEPEPSGVAWHSPEETQRLLTLMSPLNLAKVRHAQAAGGLQIGAIYKRTRTHNGAKGQRAEVRFDGISGCLRTPAGGSSRQTILVVEGDTIRSRLLSVREAARLMGLPDSYTLPERYNDGYHVMGDAVAVPVVSWLEAHILHPLAVSQLEVAGVG